MHHFATDTSRFLVRASKVGGHVTLRGASMAPEISLVIPAYNEADNVPELRRRVTALFDQHPDRRFELVIVDDHSKDETGKRVKAWADEDGRIKYVRLSRNSGSHTALYAGMSECRGKAAVFLAADLQDPPAVIPRMLNQWKEGNDVVWAVRAARLGEKKSTTLFSAVYHFVMKRWVLPEMPATGADFFLIDRKVIDAYLTVEERNADFINMVLWMGFKQSFIPYVKEARASGTSKWTFAKKLKLFVDSIVSFSFAPIRLMSAVGALFAFGGFAYAGVVIVGRLFGLVLANTGFAATMTAILVGQGMIMLMLGVMGEYLWRALDEARRRPRFFVEERYGAGTPDAQLRTEPITVVTLGPEKGPELPKKDVEP